MYPPEEPDGNRGDDECVTVKQSRRFRGHVPAKVLQEELLFLRESFRGLCGHFYELNFRDAGTNGNLWDETWTRNEDELWKLVLKLCLWR